MSQKHPLHELQQQIDPAVLNAAADEYADLMLTMCLCMKLAGRHVQKSAPVRWR